MAVIRRAPGRTFSRISIAAGVALALADASVVTLALPEILNRLDTTIDGVAAVIGVYTVVLAVTVLLVVPLRHRIGSGALGAAGMLLFAAASVACGLSETMPLLLAARGVQAVGAAAGLVAGYALLHDSDRAPVRAADYQPSRLWVAGAVFGTAIGPALGGALTELFDWRAIFLAQAPVGVLAAGAALALGRLEPVPALGVDAPTLPHPRAPRARVPTPPAHADPTPRPIASDPAPHRLRGDRIRAGITLALVSAALTAVVFLLVLMLVSGWSMQPLDAALVVTILPIAALAGSRIGGDPWLRACAGSGLIGAGILALTTVPDSSVGWVVIPQILAGVGMGMALPALAGELLPEHTPHAAARLLSLRHVGITVALLILAPVTAAQLDQTVDDVRQQVTALVLDAKLPPQEKLQAIGPALGSLDPEDARGSLETSLTAQASRFTDDADDEQTFAGLVVRADETLVSAVNGAFRPAFLITGVLALLAAALVVPPAGRRPVAALAVCAVALGVAGAQVLVADRARPDAIVVADPCQERDLPSTGGFDGAVQDVALRGLDRAACRFGSTREELALAITSEKRGKAFEQKYGENPRSVSDLLSGALTGGGGGGPVGDVLRNLFGGG